MFSMLFLRYQYLLANKDFHGRHAHGRPLLWGTGERTPRLATIDSNRLYLVPCPSTVKSTWRHCISSHSLLIGHGTVIGMAVMIL